MKIFTLNCLFLIILLGVLLTLSGCVTNSKLNDISSPFQASANQPMVPEVKLNFALPNDYRKDPIKLKSVGVTENCDLSGTCSSAPKSNTTNFPNQ